MKPFFKNASTQDEDTEENAPNYMCAPFSSYKTETNELLLKIAKTAIEESLDQALIAKFSELSRFVSSEWAKVKIRISELEEEQQTFFTPQKRRISAINQVDKDREKITKESDHWYRETKEEINHLKGRLKEELLDVFKNSLSDNMIRVALSLYFLLTKDFIQGAVSILNDRIQKQCENAVAENTERYIKSIAEFAENYNDRVEIYLKGVSYPKFNVSYELENAVLEVKDIASKALAPTALKLGLDTS